MDNKKDINLSGKHNIIPKPIRLNKAWQCDWCNNIFKTKKEATECCL